MKIKTKNNKLIIELDTTLMQCKIQNFIILILAVVLLALELLWVMRLIVVVDN